ncbi:MAG: tetratricopeptide repeat protein [Cyanobacteria bacterium P01_G01_bin.54]
MRLGVWQRVQAEESLKAREPGVFMVTGAESLLFVSLKGERTGIDKFMGYLQWGREGLMEFKYPIVLWITQQIYLQMINLSDSVRALDFWSWRRGSYQFEPEAVEVREDLSSSLALMAQPLQERFEQEEEPVGLSFEDLKELIAQVEKRNPKDPKLGSLYDQLGERYRWRLRQGQAEDAAQERRKAEDCFQRAIRLQRELGLKSDLVTSFRHQGWLYKDAAEYSKAIDSHQMSLDLAHEVGDRQGEANALNDLGDAHKSLGEYQKAITFHEHALKIKREIGDRRGEAISLKNLGDVYNALGKYREAITFHEHALKIKREIGDRRGEAESLGSLGHDYYGLREYHKAIALHKEDLVISCEIGDRHGEAQCLNNLGNAYNSLKEYQKAIDFHEKSLDISREVGDTSLEGASLCNIGRAHKNLNEYETSISYYETALDILRKISHRHFMAITLENLGDALIKTARKFEAIDTYRKALVLYQEMGIESSVEFCQKRIDALGKISFAGTIREDPIYYPPFDHNSSIFSRNTTNPLQRWLRSQKYLWQKGKHPLQHLWRFWVRLFR